MKKPVLLSWSTGKDAAWTLHCLRQSNDLEVAALLTTYDSRTQRVTGQGVDIQWLEKQAQWLNLPLIKVDIPYRCANAVYEQAMSDALDQARLHYGTHICAFGDLFLDDIRRYRSQLLQKYGYESVYPIWTSRTDQLARDMLNAGLQAYVTCVDSEQLAPDYCGRLYNEEFLRDLPEGVDPCGENGEFHTFAFAGPMFSHSKTNDPAIEIKVTPGETKQEGRFVYTDLH